MTTKCSNCDKVLTSEYGERFESAHFDSSLSHMKKANTDAITYAWCESCYSFLTQTRRKT